LQKHVTRLDETKTPICRRPRGERAQRMTPRIERTRYTVRVIPDVGNQPVHDVLPAKYGIRRQRRLGR